MLPICSEDSNMKLNPSAGKIFCDSPDPPQESEENELEGAEEGGVAGGGTTTGEEDTSGPGGANKR